MEIYRPPLANPSPGGLYPAATVIDYPDPSRLAAGIQVISMNCGPSWLWPIDCDAEIPDPNPKTSERLPDLPPFTGDVVGADDDCSLAVPEAEARQRAEQLLRLHEAVLVEAQLVPKLLAAAGAPTDVAGAVAAVGALEELAAVFGFVGVIHAAPHLAAVMAANHLVTRTGAVLTSPSGHRWAFGSGYTALDETLVITGPVAVHRGPLIPSAGYDIQHNDRLNLAEREVVVTWECFADAVTIGA